ncbi:MAG TPA: hypothetical protein VGJ20_16715 [Xanthobacteraceae bacterium]|jgi:hypothetical protein
MSPRQATAADGATTTAGVAWVKKASRGTGGAPRVDPNVTPRHVPAEEF